jgi:predicted alpha-1,6-mannanase (GH76 family)
MTVRAALRFAIAATAMFLLSGFTQADLEKAKATKDYYKDNYWNCLATEIVQKETTDISVQEFSVFVKRVCSQDRGLFFKTLIDYMAMLHSDLADDYGRLASAANIAVMAAQTDAVKVFANRRSGSKEK